MTGRELLALLSRLNDNELNRPVRVFVPAEVGRIRDRKDQEVDVDDLQVTPTHLEVELV